MIAIKRAPAWAYTPAARQCTDLAGVALGVDECDDSHEHAVLLTILAGGSVHVREQDVTELVWQIVARAADPYRVINDLIRMMVQRALDAPHHSC